MTAVLRYLLRKFYLFTAIALISLAVLVQAGRSFSPLIGDYRTDIADYIGAQLNAKVTLGNISAQWEGLMPIWEVADLRIFSQDDDPILAFERARLRLDLLSSLWNWQLVWGTVSLRGTALEFAQTPEGFWRIPGLPQTNKKAPESAQMDLLVDMLLLANKIEFQQTHLRFDFVSGHQIALDSPSLLLENQGQFHRLSLAIDLEARERAVALVVEGFGDPRNTENFRANAFLELNDFPTSEPLAAASALLLGNVVSSELRSEGALNARLWFTSQPANTGVDISGQLELQTLLVPLFEQQYRLDRFSTEVSGHWLRTGAWRMGLMRINAGLQEASITDVNMAISAAAVQAPLQLQLDKLELSDWINVLDQAGLAGKGALHDVIQSLSPRGQLNDVLVTLPLAKPTDWQLEAVGEQLSVNAWQGVPALTGVDGYIKAGQKGGFINLDSRQGFSMLYENTYAEAMHYQTASGQVAWHLQPENNRVYVNSGALRLHNDTEDATGYLWLSLPWQRNTGDIDLYLHIGARNLAASLYPKYLPMLVPDSLSSWLEKSIGLTNSGAVSEAGFLFRGTLNTPNHNARSHQLYLDVKGAELAYHTDWPSLRELNGRLLINDNDVDASVDSGKIYDSDVAYARISTRPNSDDSGPILTVNGQVKGLASDGLRVLREGYLRQHTGEHMDSWLLSGIMTADIDIAVPLASGAGGAAQDIKVHFNAPRFELGEFQLTATDVQGDIRYSHRTGITSDNLQGVLFGEAVTAKLATQLIPDESPKTLIELTGTVDPNKLAEWSQRPELTFLNGKSLPYHTQIELIHRREIAKTEFGNVDNNPLLATIKAESNLAQIAVALPAPFGKQAKSKRSLILDMDIRKQTMGIALDYRDKNKILAQAQFLVERQDKRLLNANIALGAEAHLPSEPQFMLSGYLPTLETVQWEQLFRDYESASARLLTSIEANENNPAVSNTDGKIAGLPLRAEITLASHQLGPLLLKDLSLRAWQEDQIWHLSFANPILTGDLQLPADKKLPMTIAVKELHLSRALLGDKDAEAAIPTLEQSAELTDEADAFHPASFPRANVSVNELYVDGNNYGNWSLQVHPDANGVLFDHIRGNIRGLTVSGIQPHNVDAKSSAPLDDSGAQIYWSANEQGTQTRFVGSLTAGDMTEVLLAWQKPDMIESTSASYQVDLSWPGAPGEFALLNLTGDIDLFLRDGRFKRTTGAGEGILRLFALVNFDSLARRLRLDFSDLYKSGLTYDEVQGKMHFDDGKIYFSEPILVQSPSSRLQMAGTINLHDETIDTRLIAALPVAGNLTFLAAFAAGLPAAAGIYLVSKIFRKQVDQATSMSYSIKGSWDDPIMKFDRLFESEASLRNSVSNREKAEDASANNAEANNHGLITELSVEEDSAENSSTDELPAENQQQREPAALENKTDEDIAPLEDYVPVVD